ncbi:hypothetical protein [Devosia sp. CN2-171]|jgi:hypothetical protein|uniref:hypothetical protein n=1 Tax=Devosia sp. CN2-171 TaxID=3400909 RepID=UPI003BF831BD
MGNNHEQRVKGVRDEIAGVEVSRRPRVAVPVTGGSIDCSHSEAMVRACRINRRVEAQEPVVTSEVIAYRVSFLYVTR